MTYETGDAREETAAILRRRYEAGASLQLLADGTGRSKAHIRGLLLEAGTQLRRPGRRQTRKSA